MQGLAEVVFVFQFRKVAGRAAHLQGGERGERNVFLNLHNLLLATGDLQFCKLAISGFSNYPLQFTLQTVTTKLKLEESPCIPKLC